MSRSRSWATLAMALAVAGTGCGIIAGVSDHELQPGGTGGGAGSGASGGAGGGGGGAGGSGGTSTALVVLADQPDLLPHALVLDDTHAYWVTERAGSRAVWKVPKSGGEAPVKLADVADPKGDNPSEVEIGIAVDIDDVYWGESAGDSSCDAADTMNYLQTKVRSVPKAGGAPVDVWTDCPGDVTGIAVDGLYVFFAYFNSRRLFRVRKGTLEVEMVTDNQYDPFDVIVDDSRVYWIARNDNNAEGHIRTELKEPLSSPSSDLFSVFGDLARRPNAIAGDADDIYWVDGDMVRAIPKMGNSTPRDIASGTGVYSALALDETHVYWADAAGGRILRAPRTGELVEPEVVATGQNDPEAIAVDDKAIYWTNFGRGDLVKLLKPAP